LGGVEQKAYKVLASVKKQNQFPTFVESYQSRKKRSNNNNNTQNLLDMSNLKERLIVQISPPNLAHVLLL
jgi:hypothetical protein